MHTVEKNVLSYTNISCKKKKYAGGIHIWETSGKTKNNLTFIRISSIRTPCKGANMFIIFVTKKID